MNLPRLPTRMVRFGRVACLIAFLSVGAATLVSAQGSSSSTIHACVSRDDEGGNLRIVGPNDSCKKHETALDWNSQGPPGPVGPAGPQGAAGKDGATGPAGPQGPVGNTGATGAAGPQGPAGKEGAAGAPGQVGPPGAQGSTGSVGPAGAQGPQGATGSQGPAGQDAPRLFARLNADGSIAAASPGVDHNPNATGKFQINGSVGQYQVSFYPVLVQQCAAVASIHGPSFLSPTVGSATVGFSSFYQVTVQIFDAGGNPINAAFDLVVMC